MNLFKKYNTIYFLYFFCIVIFISEARRTHTRTRGNHHKHHHGSSKTSRSQISGTKAQQMCAKYTAQVCNEKTSSKRSLISQRSTGISHRGHLPMNPSKIVGGREARPKEYPHMAQIGYYHYSEIVWLCGGSLISEKFVMSAAHCATPTVPVRILLGELNWHSTNDDAKPVEYKILKVISHPRYDPTLVRNDIALFKFQGVKKFTEYIRPICLNVPEHISKQKLVAVGWGKTSGKGPVSKHLLTVELNQESSANCKKIFPDLEFDRTKMICAGYAPGGKDTCSGDSGGPLQIFNNQVKCQRMPIYTQVGITSAGPEKCGAPGEPAKYTKVSYYIPWIESIVWN